MSGKKRTSSMGKIIKIWSQQTNGPPQNLSNKEHEAAVKRTMEIFFNQQRNAKKGAKLFRRALRGKGKKKTKKKKTKKKRRKGGKRKSMKSNKRSRRKRRGSKKRR